MFHSFLLQNTPNNIFSPNCNCRRSSPGRIGIAEPACIGTEVALFINGDNRQSPNQGSFMMYKPILLACVVLLASQTTPAQTQTSSSRQGSTNQRANLSILASNVLTDTDQARRAIASNDKDTALQKVNHALDVVNMIQSASGAEAQVVPIYTELQQVAIIGPIEAAKARKEGQAGGTRRSNTQSNPNTTESRQTETTPAVQEVKARYTSVSLDMGMAKDHLMAAKGALEKGSLEEADAALAAVQNGVVLTAVESDLPLLKARQNLILAKALAQQGRDPSGPLKVAADALAEYAAISSDPHASEASKLRNEIEANLASATTDKIDSWWTQTASWMSQRQTQ
jgi:hypothetical protein